MGPPRVVTLLFTDIEGSTRAWEKHPEQMHVALRRHDQILRQEIEQLGGHVFKTVGDAFCAAFSEALPSVYAAISIQRSIGSESWPESTPIRVRIGIHAGICQERDDDYFGPTVNRTARLQATAHGGQIVVSGIIADLIASGLPPDVSLSDLGSHRLKDLERTERIFQVRARGLQDEFPPLRSLDNPRMRNNLPRQVSTLVGRSQDVGEVSELLNHARMVTLTGAGGVGKTRLALQAAAEVLDGSGDGVWFVDLAPLADPALVAGTAASVLGIREEAGRSVSDTLVDAIRDRNLLLVLDNCEHVIDAAAHLAHRILASSSRVGVLATSREPLGLAGEQVYRVRSLSVPPETETDVDKVVRYEAVQLFVERAAQYQAGFSLEATNAAQVARLVRRLDGIPLAIELATARLGSLSVAELEARLGQRFRLLVGGPRTAMPRQQTLGALIEWSYHLLSATEQLVLDRLAIFAGGFDLSAAEAVASDDEIEPLDVIDLVKSLVDKSLVQADVGGMVRYRLLESIRDYAAGKLAVRGSDEFERTERAHRDYFLRVAEGAAPHLIAHDQVDWLDRLSADYDNLRLALARCLVDADPEPGLRLAAALTYFWLYRDHAAEGADVLLAHIDRPEAQKPTASRGRALFSAARLMASVLGEHLAARPRVEEAYRIAEDLGDENLRAWTQWIIAVSDGRSGNLESGLARIEDALSAARLIGDNHMLAQIANEYGLTLARLDRDPTGALEESLAYCRKSGNRIFATLVLSNIGYLELCAGDIDNAKLHLEESLALARDQHDGSGVNYAACNLGFVALKERDFERARTLLTEALALAGHSHDKAVVASAVLGLALIAGEGGSPRVEAMLQGAADAVYDDAHETPTGIESDLRDEHLVRLQEQMGSEALEAARLEGRQLTLDEVTNLLSQLNCARP